MRVLIVCSENSGKIAPFISEQVDSLTQLGIETSYFTVKSKGWIGYLISRWLLIQKISVFKPDIIHAHYGLSGLLANLQRKVPVVTTYHGSDINNQKVFKLSKWAIKLSAFNIFVSEKNLAKAGYPHKSALIPCGIDTEIFKPVDKKMARSRFGFDDEEKLVLFAGSFENKVKNPQLAHDAVNKLNGVRLIELKGYSREEVALLMNAVDCCLMTSYTEGSPQFIKEAMACNCPIVSVDVGDVKKMISDVKGCYVAEYKSDDIAKKVSSSLNNYEKIHSREKLLTLNLDLATTAKKILKVYEAF